MANAATSAAYTLAAGATGKVRQVIGAVVDVQFNEHLPAILNAIETNNQGNRFGEEVVGCRRPRK